jgi:hypothetical protein
MELAPHLALWGGTTGFIGGRLAAVWHGASNCASSTPRSAAEDEDHQSPNSQLGADAQLTLSGRRRGGEESSVTSQGVASGYASLDPRIRYE